MPGGLERDGRGGRAILREAALRRSATALLRRHGRAILGFLASVLHDREAALEAYGAFEEDLWRGLPGFRGECSRKQWAYRLAWHAALRYLRDPYRLRRVPLDSRADLPVSPQGSSDEVDGGEDRSQAIHALRAALRPEEETLLRLRVDGKLTWEQVAEVIARPGEPPPDATALRKRFERLKTKLTRQAREAGLSFGSLPPPARPGKSRAKET